jgi:DNA-binding cell septation regulator SpoVG
MTALSQSELRRAERATWGQPPHTTEKHAVRQARFKKWTPHRSGALRGFCSVQLASGMVLNDLRLMTGKNGLRVAMPAQKQLNRDGQPRLETNGKPIYSQIVELKDKATADRFRDLVVKLVRAEGDLENDALAPRQAEARSAPARRRSTYPRRPAGGRDEPSDAMPNDRVDDLWSVQ